MTIAPKRTRKKCARWSARWDIHNMRLAIEAKDREYGFDQIAASIIETSVGSAQIKEAMRESTVEGVIARLR